MDGIVIPTKKPEILNYVVNIDTIVSEGFDQLSLDSKMQIQLEKQRQEEEQKKREEDKKEENQKESKLMKFWKMVHDPEVVKKREKITDLWSKNLKPFLKGAFQAFKGLASKVGGILTFFVGLFLLFKLGILQTLIPAIGGMLTEIINGIVAYLPTLIKFVADVFFNYLPKIASQVYKTILDTMGIAKDSPWRSFAEWLGKATPYILALVGAFKLLSSFGVSLLPSLRTLVNIFRFAIKWLPKLLSVGTKAIPIIGWIVAIISALVVVWKKAEKISDWFDNLWEKFKNLGSGSKALVIALGAIFAPLTAMVGGIVLLAKAFKKIKKDGFKAFAVDLGNFFKDLFLNIFKKLSSLFDKVPAPLKDLMKNVLKLIIWPYRLLIFRLKNIKKILTGVLNVVKSFGDAIGDLFSGRISGREFLGKIVDLVTDTAKDIGGWILDQVKYAFVGPIKAIFSSLTKVFQGVIDSLTYGFSKIPGVSIETYGAESLAEYIALSQAQRVFTNQESTKRISKLASAKTEAERLKARQALTEEEREVVAKMSPEDMKQIIAAYSRGEKAGNKAIESKKGAILNVFNINPNSNTQKQV